ncbi:hypothetical protein [Nitratidesulfovibrio sp. SRB-5]|nr:hypothetical protein [Nitratidesulfovibrio sp. SRB-5]MBZ2172351.1 hypothetical protein [Nitratidesulfovibrio sp. SRB-5]
MLDIREAAGHLPRFSPHAVRPNFFWVFLSGQRVVSFMASAMKLCG